MLRVRTPLDYQTAGATYTLTAAAGSFTLNGSAATLKVSRKLTAAAGSFALTGSAATLKAARVLTAGSGAFALAGSSATLKAARKLTASAGSFVLTGSSATLTKGSGATYTLTALAGAFVLTGKSAAFIYTPLPPRRIRPTAGGWAPARPAEPNWASGDLARGTAWAAKPKGNATW